MISYLKILEMSLDLFMADSHGLSRIKLGSI